MDRGGGRKKSGSRQEESPHVMAAKEEILPGYEEYLVLLQERNKLLKRLRKKDKGQIDQERREQGFSLYVNGPHKAGKHAAAAAANNRPTIPTQPGQQTARKPKTAGERPVNARVLDNHALQEIAREEMEKQREMARARTAPSARERRRNWNVESVEIQTVSGGKKIKAPEVLSGKYADDFESGDDSDELRSSGSENTEVSSQQKSRKPLRKPPPPRESDMFNSSDSICSEEDMEDDDSYDDDDDGPNEKLMLSMKELKTLRQSLAQNAAIRQSLAKHGSKGEQSYEGESPIPECEEDLPTDVSTSMDADDTPRRLPMKPDDTIVLEFGGAPPPGKKQARNLSAARRKDLDEGEYCSGIGPGQRNDRSRSEPSQGNGRSNVTKTLGAGAPQKKPVRPLSANRRNAQAQSQDTDQEASAVMAALRAENEQASKHKQTPRQSGQVTPRQGISKQTTSAKQRPSPKAARDRLVKPLYDQSEAPPRGSFSPEAEDVAEPLVPLDKIGQIMERVLRMTPKHQRHLVNMLGKLERSMVMDSVDQSAVKPRASGNGEPRPRGSGQSRKSRDSPLRAVYSSSISKSYSTAVGGDDDDSNVIEIHIEVRSNWGHSMRLGLTEIQVYDQTGGLVPVSTADVSIHGAEECQGTVDLLFNNKYKTNKERNMWTCRYHARRPVEFILRVRNPRPDSREKFALSQLKIWNYNKSIADLDIGIKDVRIFVGSDLVFNGAIEKGCGNQVFDYGHVISITPQVNSSADSNPVIEVEKSDSPEVPVKSSKKPNGNTVPVNSEKVLSQVRTSSDKRQKRREANEVKSKQSSAQTPRSRERVELLNKPEKTQNRPPVSPRGERSPSPAPKFPMNSPREGRNQVNHRSISPHVGGDRKKTFRSISMSSQSSADSGGDSQPNSRPTSGKQTPRDPANRSQTRTLHHPVPGHSIGSDSCSESEDGPSRGSQPAKRRGSKTVKKSKRMAARLDGHSSAEVDSSKSVSESTESRPPIPQRKSEEKISRKGAVQKYLEQKKQGADKPTEEPPAVTRDNRQESETELEDTLKAGNTTVSSSVSVASSQDDTPMLQKLKDMNKKEMSSSRKKDVPRWLKQEDISTPFENPPESRDGPRPEPNKPDAPPSNSRTPGNKTVTPPGTKARATPSKARTPPRKEVKPSTPPTQEEINMLIDEEMSLFPDQKKGVDLPEPAESEANPTTPMQRIEKNRSKWRESPGMNLEESWGSLSQFNKCQRGRLSLDMDDDVMDEYINKAAKMAGLPTEPAIPEEDGGDTEQQMQQPLTDSDDENFVIPELPQGRELVLNIRSTWGDKHYVGLTGIEVFAATGEQVNIIKVHANPSDINILPEYNKDPRVVKNIIDGQNRTRDDIHMWLAPFMQGMDHTVHCTFDKPCKVAIIRIWNYNKSRIHSYRGARDVVMALDQTVIFRGEIARACGGIEGGTEAFGDTILFTTDEVILEKVSQNDEAYEAEMLSDDEPFDVERPSTADEGEEKGRPLTRAVGNIKALERELTVQYEGDMMVFRGRYLELNFTATWGDMHYLGLTGLEVVGKDGDALPVDVGMISANPRDVRVLPGHEEDDRTLDKVVDGTNITMSDEHMWLVPFTDGQNHTVTIDFGQKELMAGLRVWNYNKSKEDTYRGARIMHVNIDGKTVSPPEGFLVRKGLGTCHFDFAQEISFSPQSWVTNAPLSAMGQSMDDDNYEVVQMPCGFIYQLQLFSTWGDAYYVGLNGIELYDANNKKIQLTESNISAYPDSVNVLDNIDSDVRTPDKLIDGVNDTLDGGHMWLAPILPNMLNRVYVIFDQPTTISMLKIWNYSKTANRGAKDFALLVDDLLVYNGVLQSVPQTARGILPTCEGPQPYHTILFTNNKEVLRKERNTVINHQTGEQDVQMTNDKKIVTHYNDPHKAKSGKTVDQNLRPTTSVIHSKKRR